MRHFNDKEFDPSVYRYIGSMMILLLLVCGCATTQGVRYVYQDREFGVIGMPENTDEWPTHYRRQAEKLMEEHFPEGHEIVRAEEVTEGSRTLKVEGSKIAEVTPQLPADLLRIAKIGGSSSHSQADTLKLKECRIIYRRIPKSETANARDWGPAKSQPKLGSRPTRLEGVDFADQAAVTPSQYLDPNDLERRKVRKDASESIAAPKGTEQKYLVAKPVADPAPKGD